MIDAIRVLRRAVRLVTEVYHQPAGTRASLAEPI
jgi:hypothetical protein